MESKIKIAILDDYQSVALQIFQPLLQKYPSLLEIVDIKDTLPPFSHPLTSQESRNQLIQRLKPFTIISTMRERTSFPGALLKELPNLKVLLTTGNRNAAIDVQAAIGQGIVVAGTFGKRSQKSSNIPRAIGPDSTTQHTWALILGIARGVARDDAVIKAGGWQTDFTTGLTGKTLAILGLGRLGLEVAKIGYLSFGMQIIAWSSSLTQADADQKAQALGLPIEDGKGTKTFTVVKKQELFKNADFLSIHYVLSDRSRGIVGAQDLALMKPSSFLVNTSRGPLIDEKALLEVLNEGKIAGAALDVFELEPLPSDSPWRTTKWGTGRTSQVLLSPHMGYVETQTIHGWYEETVENVERFLEGKELTCKFG